MILADLTHRYIEQPLRHLKLPPRTVIRSAIIATCVATSIGGAIILTANDVVTLPTGESYRISELTQRPVVYDDGCHVNNGETKSPSCTYGPSSTRKIVLFGDSHAAQWQPVLEKLATEEGFQLISLTKSACPGPAVRKVESGSYKNADCNAWRENSIARIQQIQPEAVIVSGMQNFEVPKGYASRRSWWIQGEAKTYLALQGSSSNLIYLSDTPRPLRDIPSCIAAGRLDKCNGTQATPAIFTPGWERINPTSWFCNGKCPAVIDGVVIYRDSSHLSVRGALSVKRELRTALQNLGVLPLS